MFSKMFQALSNVFIAPLGENHHGRCESGLCMQVSLVVCKACKSCVSINHLYHLNFLHLHLYYCCVYIYLHLLTQPCVNVLSCVIVYIIIMHKVTLSLGLLPPHQQKSLDLQLVFTTVFQSKATFYNYFANSRLRQVANDKQLQKPITS